MSSHRADFYVQIEPIWTRNGNLHSIQATRLTQRKPYRPLPGTVLVKLAVQVPDSAFEAFEPPVIVVPESLIVASALTAEVADANDEADE
jgi:hypothetical protein